MLEKEEAIKTVYYDEEDGFGSMANTLKHARKYNDEITLEDVRLWYARHLGTKRQLKGYNSFIAREAYQHYQMDIFFLKI